MIIAEAFGRVLRTTRRRKHISQEELAEATGLDRTFISLLERGKRQPSLSTIMLLAKALKTSAHELIKEVEAEIHEN